MTIRIPAAAQRGGEVEGTYRYGEPFAVGRQSAVILFADEHEARSGRHSLRVVLGLRRRAGAAYQPTPDAPPLAPGEPPPGCRCDDYVPLSGGRVAAFLAALGYMPGEADIELEPRALAGTRVEVEVAEEKDSLRGGPRPRVRRWLPPAADGPSPAPRRAVEPPAWAPPEEEIPW